MLQDPDETWVLVVAVVKEALYLEGAAWVSSPCESWWLAALGVEAAVLAAKLRARPVPEGLQHRSAWPGEAIRALYA